MLSQTQTKNFNNECSAIDTTYDMSPGEESRFTVLSDEFRDIVRGDEIKIEKVTDAFEMFEKDIPEQMYFIGVTKNIGYASDDESQPEIEFWIYDAKKDTSWIFGVDNFKITKV